MQKKINVYYSRMYEIIKPLFKKGDKFSSRQLAEKLYKNNLSSLFEKTYHLDCNCISFKWSFFDFSDRFQRFANHLAACGICEKVDRGIWIWN